VELKNKVGVGWLYLARLELIRMKIWLNIWMESRMAREQEEQIQRGMERFLFAREERRTMIGDLGKNRFFTWIEHL
jgi:hypothetical protein